MSQKMNCWEIKKCGREIGGANVDDLGVCLTATYSEYNGINGGRNGGRVCWAITGTLCNGNVSGTLAEKQSYCTTCSFFRMVIQEVDSESAVLI
jgi:hypothetical protein